MNLAPGSIAALSTAQPGWTVTIEWINSDDEAETLPIVAWVAVVGANHEDGLATTNLQPAFFHSGFLYTEAEFRSDMSVGSPSNERLAIRINPPAEGAH